MERCQLPGFYLGESAVWDDLYTKYYRLVVHVVRSKNIPRDDIPDVAQETWLRAYDRRTCFDARNSQSDESLAKQFSAWIGVLSAHEAINWHRRQKQHKLTASAGDLDLTALSRVCRVLFENDLAERRFDLDTVEGLSDEESFVLHQQQQGRILKEIAETLGTSQATVYRVSKRAKEKLLASF